MWNDNNLVMIILKKSIAAFGWTVNECGSGIRLKVCNIFKHKKGVRIRIKIEPEN